ncbi:alpha/beta hydrolase [Pseudoroseomonas oryzae]|uniref:Alpha/beta hydrolase n=2 Tax=Teichococcus oryzae TaxID=1608942 RepID=A0A5B2TGJ7_9PROT|nr:alpha/beta hydrolase [Pseudoroseomonas oryzae]
MTEYPTQPLALPGGSAPRRRGFVDRPDARLYFEAVGEGPALVFGHGLGGNHLSWWRQVGHFATGHCCITFSHRGFFPSEAAAAPDPAAYADDLAALLDALRIEAPVFVGQSMGGWTGIDFALRHPGRLRGLVLSATSGPIDPRSAGPEAEALLAEWASRAEAAKAAGAARGVHPAAGARMAEEQPALHLLYRAVDELSAGLDKEALRRRMFAARTRPASDLEGLRLPTLWITGAEDVVFPAPMAPLLAARMPDARHVEIPDAGHSPYFERPEAFNAAFGEFLNRI